MLSPSRVLEQRQTLLAGFALLHVAGTARGVPGRSETTMPGALQLARFAFAGDSWH